MASLLVSMTGYGSGLTASAEYRVKVEARSVNHRFGEIVVRAPKGYQAIEERVRRLAGEYVERGRMEIFVSIEDFQGKQRTVRLDKGLLDGYRRVFAEAGEALGLGGALTLDMLPALPDLFVVSEVEVDVEDVWPLVERAAREALERLVAMRAAEGRRLEEDMLRRLAGVETLLAAIARRSPVVVELYRKRLAERIAELLSQEVDEQRIALEVALFADKSNIDEEITRAQSHIEQFRSACASGEAVGRKLDFLLQELHREINTIGAKAQDGEIARLVVEVKAELEKIREQAQNIQ